jgi:hypothetical protein
VVCGYLRPRLSTQSAVLNIKFNGIEGQQITEEEKAKLRSLAVAEITREEIQGFFLLELLQDPDCPANFELSME